MNQFRLATKDDLDEVCEIERASFEKEMQINRDGLRRFIILKQVIVDEGVTVVAVIQPRRGNAVRIYSLAVHPDFRRDGRAQAILKYIEQQYDQIRFEVQINNHAAIAMYKKAGYEATGMKKYYYHDYSHALVMTKVRNKEGVKYAKGLKNQNQARQNSH